MTENQAIPPFYAMKEGDYFYVQTNSRTLLLFGASVVLPEVLKFTFCDKDTEATAMLQVEDGTSCDEKNLQVKKLVYLTTKTQTLADPNSCLCGKIELEVRNDDLNTGTYYLIIIN